jgi:branched-chain amino acid transport system permease protein
MNKGKALLLLTGLALLVYPVLPFSSDYILHVMTLAMVYMILAMGLNIVPGFCGLLDLGYVGFYGLGAYAAGLLTIHYGLSFWVIVPLAALNGALWGALLGAPTLRLTGDYFAIVTFGFSELVVLFLTNEIWLTRGPLGLPGIAPITLNLTWLHPEWYFEFYDKVPNFYLVALLVGLVYFIMGRMEDSRLGRAWYAIREDPLAAASCGVNILNYKVIAFAISAGIGGVGGCFYARWSMFLSPDMFKFWESFLVLCMVVLGGLGNIRGALVGAAVLVGLGEVLREVLTTLGLPAETRFMAYGLIMVLMMRFKPAGFFPAIAASGRSSLLMEALQARIAAGVYSKEDDRGTAA